MAYIPNPDDVTQPTGSTDADTAPAEFRAIKVKLATLTGNLVTISPFDKSTNVLLSGGNLTAESSAAAAAPPWEYGRANIGKSSGRWYFEVTFTNITGAVGVGFALADTDITPAGLGFDAESVVLYAPTEETVFNSVVQAGTGPISNGVTYGIGIDLEAGAFLIKKSSGSAVLYAYATLASGETYYPAFCFSSPNSKITFNFGASAFVRGLPSGYLPFYIPPYNFSENPNLIFNGSCRIDQQNAGAAQNPIAAAAYMTDGWQFNTNVAGKFQAQQNLGAITPPVGYSNYQGLEVLAAYVPAAGEYFSVDHKIEGYDIAPLRFGSTEAFPLTLTFMVYCTVAGFYSGVLTNYDSTRFFGFTYAVPVASVWTQITIQIPGDSGTPWDQIEELVGMVLRFDLGSNTDVRGIGDAWGTSASVKRGVITAANVVGTLGARFCITGVELRRGLYLDTQPREMLTAAEELERCLRYYWKTDAGQQVLGYAAGAAIAMVAPLKFPAPMRITPTVSATFSGGVNVASSGVQAIGKYGCELFTTSTGAGNTAATYNAGNTADARM